ncbi:DNA gyrase subunit A [Frankliniella fusca]|uniref:DNA gyrase subunit A n=1 Tax=Frankliniella fusca TaxID=407009 RepID=A0AAE1HE79_9NEOP|nr:DNA gyrase subunit A [Frankliniella fusca]
MVLSLDRSHDLEEAYNAVADGMDYRLMPLANTLESTSVVHPANIWKFLEEIRAEEHVFHQLLPQVRAGYINVKQPVYKKYKMCQRWLHNVSESYKERC